MQHTEPLPNRLTVAFGPEFTEHGSWQWIGADLASELSRDFETVTFHETVPECDAVVFVKFKPSAEILQQLARHAAVLYCPVDSYGSSAEIEADEPALRCCSRIVVHCERLRPFLSRYAPVEYVDHHVKFAAPLRQHHFLDGPFLWCGVRTNLPPLLEWVNGHELPGELWILTNSENVHQPLRATDFGFRRADHVRIAHWSADRQREWTAMARAALDVKGRDFRARHKPPAKAIDFVASGVPLAMNADSSSAEHLSRHGLRLALPDDFERWLSEDYWQDTAAIGRTFRQQLTLEQVGFRWRDIIVSAAFEKAEKKRYGLVPSALGTKPIAAGYSRIRRTKVALLSLLFNWPSTGGGTVHTFETAEFLTRAGYDVRHIYARFPDWDLGEVQQDELPYAATGLDFDQPMWNALEIQRRFREAVDDFHPDAVIITDSWNFKPLLAQAVQGYRYFLRLAALECLCPLNNVRLLAESSEDLSQCARHQLATPGECRRCVGQREWQSGGLHRAERMLAGYGRLEYDWLLRDAFAGAEAVLVVNPFIGEMVGPYAKQVRVIPSGFDPERFPWPAQQTARDDGRIRVLFAGLTEELMKGFHVLREACRQLWAQRQDFELVVTADGPPRAEPFARYIGWQSQADLPKQMHAADMLAFPTVAQEALGRTAVEAMGAGLPVVASRIGGLSWTVVDGVTGLLCEPGNATDLAAKINRLLDDPDLRVCMGKAGRRRFEELFQWPVILECHYRPLLGPAMRRADESSVDLKTSPPAP